MDVYQALSILEQKYPEKYDILTKVPVTFHYKNGTGQDAHHLSFRRPTIVPDIFNNFTRVYYSPPFHGPLQMSPDLVDAFYDGKKGFNVSLQHI